MKKALASIAVLFCIIVAIATTISPGYARSKNKVVLLAKDAPALNPHVLELAITAYQKAEAKGYTHSPVLTVVDFALPSNEKRLWIFNLKTNKVLYHTYVAQGRNSGLKYAHAFSNDPRSFESSLGLYKTDNAYYGSDGYSLRLTGLDGDFNSNAYRRDIVVHGAWYVTQNFIEKYGRAGRSLGCFAVSKNLATPIVNTIKGGTLLFAYYPDKDWIAHSQFL